MAWDESQHPRAPDGKFGAGGGGASQAHAQAQKAWAAAAAKVGAKGKPGAKAASKEKSAKAQAKAKIAAAKVKAKEKAAKIIASAKVKASQIKWKAGHDAAKKTAAIKAGKIADPKAARAAIAAAKKAATAKAKAIMDSAKAKAAAQSAAILAKAPVQAPAKPAAPAAVVRQAPAPTSQQQPARSLDDHDLEAARQRVMATATAQELSAAVLYSGHSYQQINTSLRTGRFNDSGLDQARMNQAIDHLDSLMGKSKLTDPVITYRGSTPHPSFANLKPGQVFVDKAFVSTTSDHQSIFENETFNGGVVFHITSPAGTKMAGIPSNYPEEKEMLLGRGTAFRLDREERGADPSGRPLRILHVTVVGQH